jgi:hypothetical protein
VFGITKPEIWLQKPVKKITLRSMAWLQNLPNRVAAKLVDIYRKNETPPEVFQHLELLKLSKEHYRKTGDGRPTKKDRRDLEDFGNETNDDETD